MYDYVIVGGGSAGCVLAARLSEDPDIRVLLLEAGSADKDRYIHMPVGFAKMTDGPHTWGYTTTPQRHCNNREMLLPQARVIGGGSSINAEVFTRGCPEDYDRWARKEGASGWSFDEIKPYFIKSEDNDVMAGEHHGHGGPLGVSSLDAHPLTKRFVQSCQEAGIPYTSDFNGPDQTGSGIYQTTTRHQKRCSTATGYLWPVSSRKNLTVRLDCMSHQILIEKGRAVGVVYYQHGKEDEVRAEREVIITSGAIGSPKLLMLSGIGPANHLQNLGIEVVRDHPGVGQNLQDHFDLDIVYELNGPHSFDKYNRWHWMLVAGLQYKLFGKGPVASNIVEGGAFWYADEKAPTPDTQFHFLPAAGVEAGVPPVPSGHGCTLNSYFLRPRSRGSVTLGGANPHDAPLIDPNYIADPYDLEMTVRGLKMMRDIMRQSALAPFIEKEHYPGDHVTSEQDHIDYVRQHGRTSYHPVGTCKIGPSSDPMAVVDPELRVRGVDGLRVCDSAIMPSLVSSNTNAATVMIGEKAADLIKGNR